MRYLFALFALGLLIALHELGHLLAARLLMIQVDRFSVGFGPPLFSFRRGPTDFTIGAIPLGGFVRIHGMNPHAPGEEEASDVRFDLRPPWQRALVIAAGSLANYLLALAILIPLYISGTHVPVPMTVGTVRPGSEAARAQLRPGDVIVSANGAPVDRWSSLVETVEELADRPMPLEVRRGSDTVAITVRPRPDARGSGRLGIGQQYVFRRHGPLEAVGQAFLHTNALVGEGVRLFWRLLRGKSGVELSSPVEIVKQTSDAASNGFEAFLRTLVSISVALALFNLLPIPGLDGGRLVLIGVEAIRGKKLGPKLETTLQAAGFLLLTALVLWVALGDIRKLFQGPNPTQTSPSK